MTPELLVGILLIACAIGLWIEQRVEARINKEGNEALLRLLEIAKQDTEDGRWARMAIAAWATTGPSI